ncbi:MAG: hypothetical protein RIK87_02880 [Fuerstiella sp.]
MERDMNQDPVTVNVADWGKLFPVLHLGHAMRLGFRLRVILPAFLCYTAMWLGLFYIAAATIPWFSTGEPLPETSEVDTVRPFPGHLLQPSPDASDHAVRTDAALPDTVTGRVLPAPVQAGLAAAAGLLTAAPLTERRLLTLGWLAICLMVFAVAIARSTATQFCQQTRTGATKGLRFAASQLKKTALSTVLAAFIVAVPMVMLFISAWLSRTTPGTWLAAMAWPVVYLLALLTVLTTLVTGLGWLLSLSAIGTDQCTGSDALSRGINYVLSHKLRTACYVTVVLIQSWLALLVSQTLLNISTAVIRPRFHQLVELATGHSIEKNNLSTTVLHWWQVSVGMLPYTIQLGVLLAGLTLIYVLLRQAEDAVHLRELDGGARSGRSS